MTMQTTVNDSPAAPSLSSIWKNGAIAAVVAAAANTLLYFAGSALGAFPDNVLTSMGTPVMLGPVIIMSVALILIGTLVYTILSRTIDNPNRWFTIIAVIVLLAMVYGPFTLTNASMLPILILELMHLVAGACAVYFLRRAGR